MPTISNDEPIVEIIHDNTVLDLLPEQEWCEECSAHDDLADGGMPQDVVDRFLDSDPEWDPALGDGPLYEITELSCGHRIVRLAGTTAANQTA